MRLLILTPEFEGTGGGISTFYRALVPALRAHGVEIRVIEGSAAYASNNNQLRFDHGVQVETLEVSRLQAWLGRFSAFEAAPTLRRHLAAAWAMWEQAGHGVAADIVEACDWGLLGIPPAIERTRPLIVQCHASAGQIGAHDPVVGEEAESALTRLTERAVFATTLLQTYSEANAAFWAAETGRDVAMIRPAWSASTQRGDSVPPGSRGLVVGRVQKWKGPQVLCEALQLMGSRAPDIDWIGGDMAWEARGGSAIGFLAHRYPNIWGRKVIHGAVAATDDIRRRQLVALFNLVPSTWDVFNFTAIEAMASGRPTIVSDGAGASELIEDGVNGFVFSSGDARELAAAIDRLLAQSPYRLTEIGRAAQETVRISCDPKSIALKRVAAYRAAIAEFELSPRMNLGGWLADICGPKEKLHTRELAFLDHHPLRSVAAAVLRRAQAKVLSWGDR